MILWLVALLVAVPNVVAVPQCIPYAYLRETPDEELICEKYGVISADEMRWVDFDHYHTNAALTVDFEVSDATNTALGTQSCFQQLYKNICLEHYPACVEVEGNAYPVMQCREPLCPAIFAECTMLMHIISGMGDMKIVRECDLVIDNKFANDLASGALTGGSKYPNYTVMVGHEWWPEESIKIPLSNGGYQEVPCDPADGALVLECLVSDKNCPAPFTLVEGRIVNGTQECPTCEMACPFLYDKSVWNQIWLAGILPGIFSVVVNTLAGITYIPKSGSTQTLTNQNRDGMMALSVLLSWTYSMWDTIPSLTISSDLFCDGNKALDPLARGKDRPILCTMNRLAVHILQAFSIAIMLNMINMYKLTSASNKMRQARKRVFGKKTLLIVLGLPMLLATLTYALDNVEERDEAGEPIPTVQMSYLRNSLRCGPRFSTMAMEAIVVHIPLLISSTISGFYAIAVLFQLKIASSKGRDSNTTSATTSGTVTTGYSVTKSGAKKTDYVSLMKKVMSRYSIMLLVFTVVYMSCAIVLVFEAEDMGLSILGWLKCLRTGETGRPIVCPSHIPEWRCKEFLPPLERAQCLDFFTIDPKLPSLLSASSAIPALLPLFFGILVAHARLKGIWKAKSQARVSAATGVGTTNVSSVATRQSMK